MTDTSISAVTAATYGKNFQVKRAPAQAAPPRKVEKEPESAALENKQTATQHPLEKLAGPIEEFVQAVGVDLKLKVDHDTGEIQAEVRDPSGEKVIRKLPSDEMLKLAASIREFSEHLVDRSL